MARKTRNTSKAASLTGDLLVRKGRDTKVGFVLTPPDELELQEKAVAAEPAPPAEAPEPKPPSAAAVLNARTADNPTPAPSPEADSPEPSPYFRMGHWSNPTAQTAGPQALVQALRQGQLERAERLFGSMSGLEADKMKEVLYGENGRDLAMVCRALGFDQLQFASTLILSRKLGPADSESDPTVLGSASELFEDTERETALDVLRRWQRDSERT